MANADSIFLHGRVAFDTAPVTSLKTDGDAGLGPPRVRQRAAISF